MFEQSTIRNTAKVFAGSLIAVIMTVIVVMYFIPDHYFTQEKPSTGFTNQMRPQTVRDIDAYSHRYPNIAAVGLISLDFQHNVRVTVYQTLDPEIMARFKKFDKDQVLPIFSDNKVQNLEMTELINGNFKCYPSSQSVFYKVYHMEGLLSTACRMPMAPGVGRVVGYYVVQFYTEPSPVQLVQVEQEMRNLSIATYFNEFVPINR